MTADRSDDDRTYPRKRPPGHKPPVPRWSLDMPAGVDTIFTIYVGVQVHSANTYASESAEEAIETLLRNSSTASWPIDTFRVTNGFDLVASKVWVIYFTDAAEYKSTLQKLDLVQVWRSLGEIRHECGLWIEHFSAPVARLETNYARLDHKPGLARLPGTTQPAHELSAYWGAGRDRIPASAHDLFPAPSDIATPTQSHTGLGRRLTGTNYDNMCHIRSGQWWEQCDDEERLAYEHDLQGTLMEGMQYLWDHPEETGTLGLRFLQNLDQRGQPMRETCGAGFFRNWGDLEKWSSRHPSHLKIYNGAMRHAKRFGPDRKFMTWHEVWIFKAGEAQFEYVNCDPKTGVIGRVEIHAENLGE